MGATQSLLGSFSPSAWSEDLYTKSPPYTLENVSGRVSIVPARPQTELVLDSLSGSLGLKKRKQGHTYYLLGRSDSIKGFRQFDWFLRRSWRNKEFSVLWALAYIGRAKGWDHQQHLNVSLESVAELTGCDVEKCAQVLVDLVEAKTIPSKREGFGDEYEVIKEKADHAMDKLLSGLPTWTEELIMSSLCSGTGGSIADIYENIMMLGVTIGAAYKIVERLKDQGYVYPLRHFRVNEKGPMRELLSANCRNCFYGFTSEEKCLLGTFRQLEDVLERYYGKELSVEEKTSLYLSIKSVPYSSRICRRVLESLRLVHQVERMTNEGRVLTMLKKIEDKCGIELPIKTAELLSTGSLQQDNKESDER